MRAHLLARIFFDCTPHFVKLSKFDKVSYPDNQLLLFTL